MGLLKGVKVISAVMVLSTIAAIHLGELATARPTPTPKPSQVAQRRRLSFRVGVRPSQFRVGGFSRSASCGDQQPMMALVPPPQAQEASTVRKDAKDPVDKTISDRPTFFVYVPTTNAKTAQFTLQNETGTEQLHSVKFRLTGKPGIVGISLPPSASALQIGQKYVWQVSVACTPDDATNTVVISSWIERVQPPTGTANQVTALAEQGIWQDAVSLLAQNRFQKPGDRTVAEDWAVLMEDAGLPQFKQAEIVQIVRN